ncbi:MAG: DUF2807 domain-containing protein [Saprospiraceae bacterium]|nr:DUF2807 domain-containing protein [Saprospiraceae bacterium]
MNRLLLCLLATALLFAPMMHAQNFWKGSLSGEGPIIKKEMSLDHFEGIRNGFSCDVYITQGNNQKVVVEGQQNILDNLRFEVSDKVLKIKYDKMVKRSEPVKIYITMNNLTEVSVSGSGSLVSTNRFSGLGDLDLRVSGSGNVKLEVEARDIEMGVSGSGDITLEGKANQMDISISGSGGVDSRNLDASTCKIQISGSGDATILVKDELDARISGSGNIRYRGDAAKVYSRVSGSGDIRSME